MAEAMSYTMEVRDIYTPDPRIDSIKVKTMDFRLLTRESTP